MYATISLHRSSRQLNDSDFIVILAWTALGLAFTGLAFALGLGVEFGQILAVAG
jgi:hypothetical protein